jgi:hypothetical protein
MATTALTFDLYRVLRLLTLDQLDQSFLNTNCTSTHVNQWHKFAFTTLRMKSQMGGRYDFSYVDRTGKMPSLINVQHDPIPAFDSNYQHCSFLDVTIDRARKLLSQDKTICVLWSGGLDSTLVLASLVSEARYKDQIEILCTWESIMEAGSLFDNVILPWGLKIRFDQTRINMQSGYTGDQGTEVYVSGSCGDQIFGRPRSAFGASFKNKQLLDAPWDQGYPQDFLDIVAPSVSVSPREIVTQKDLLWWIFFNFTWNAVCNDGKKMRPTSIAKRFENFFESWQFQQWAVSTNSYYNQTDEYRLPQNQALAKLINYPAYTDKKTKTLSTTWKSDKSWFMLDTEYKNHYTNNQTQQSGQ